VAEPVQAVAGCFGGRRRPRGGPASRRDEGVGEVHGRLGPWRMGRWLTEEGVNGGDSADSGLLGGGHQRRSR
jgi:hypothetical protein